MTDKKEDKKKDIPKKSADIEKKESDKNTESEIKVKNGDAKEDQGSEEEKIDDSKDPAEEMQEKLKAAQQEAKESYDRLLRATAEFENYKKRAAREMEDFRKYANEMLIKEFLSVVDNMERAISSSKDGDGANDSVKEGVEMTLKEVLKIFEKFNVSQVDCVEKPFDPNFHQAVMREETENYPENTIINEFQKGYILHDRLIRPAMVVVAAAKSKNDEKKEIKQDKTNSK